jgi:hypothetical protein
MRKTSLFLMTLMLVMATSAWAAPCVQGTMADYLLLGPEGCTIFDKVFYDFGYQGLNKGAADVQVIPLADNPFNPGLGFQSLWVAAGSGQMDSNITFTVAVDGDPAPLRIKDASLVMFGGARAPGSATVTEGLCLPGGGCIDTLYTFDFGLPGAVQLQDSTIFAPKGVILVMKDIGVIGGGFAGQLPGSAAISYVEDRFSQVPEPASIMLLGAALLGIGGIFRRKKAA